MSVFNINREIILDTETTGLDPKKGHKIIEIGCIELVNRIRTGRSFHAYVNPMRDVPDEAFKIHGISTDFLKDKPLFRDVVNEFIEFISGAKLVIHNAQFDVKFINHEFSLLDLSPILQELVIDTLLIARKKYPGSPASLDALCKKFNIDLSARTKHGALLDAELLADVYIELTGGAQSSMNFIAEKIEEKIINVRRNKVFREAREFQLTAEETELHEKLVDKLKKPIWNN